MWSVWCVSLREIACVPQAFWNISAAENKREWTSLFYGRLRNLMDVISKSWWQLFAAIEQSEFRASFLHFQLLLSNHAHTNIYIYIYTHNTRPNFLTRKNLIEKTRNKATTHPWFEKWCGLSALPTFSFVMIFFFLY